MYFETERVYNCIPDPTHIQKSGYITQYNNQIYDLTIN